MDNHKNDTSQFVAQFIALLNAYQKKMNVGHFLIGGKTHRRLAAKMIMQASVYLQNPTDEKWIEFINQLDAFRESLKKGNSKTLLPALNKYIAHSDFPQLLLAHRLSKYAALLNAAKEIQKPSQTQVMLDLIRLSSNILLSFNNEPAIRLSDLVSLQYDGATGQCVITEKGNAENTCSGLINQAQYAAEAISKITQIIQSKVTDQPSKDTVRNLIPFLTQNALLQYPIPNVLAMAKVLSHVDSTKQPLNTLNDFEHAAVSINPESHSFELSAPAYSVNIHINGERVDMTESYHYEKCTSANEEGVPSSHTLSTPIEVVDRFQCVISPNGQSATIQQGNIQFSASTIRTDHNIHISTSSTPTPIKH